MNRYIFPLAVVAVIFGSFYSLIDSWPTVSIFYGSFSPIIGKETFFQKHMGKSITVSPPARIIDSVEEGFFGDEIRALELGAAQKSEETVTEIKKPTYFLVATSYQHIPDFRLNIIDYCILANPEDFEMRFNIPCAELDKLIATATEPKH